MGYPLSFGSVVLHNGTDQPITITAVTVVEREAGITVLGVCTDAATSCDFNSPDDPWSHPSGPST